MSIRLIALSFVTCLSLLYFSILSRKFGDFGKKVTDKKMCFDFFHILCLKHSLSKKNLERYYHKSSLVFM